MKKLIFLPLLFFCLIGSATNYYVRSGGSDAANGTSEATAWASVSKVNSSMSSFKPGDAILFRRGDSWSNVTIIIGTGGAQGNNITIGAYGTGAKPILSSPDNNPAIKVTSANRGYWTIDNLDLRSTGIPYAAYSTVSIQHSYWQTDMGPVPGWIIQNCTFNSCIMLSGPNTLVKNNTFNGSLNSNNRGGAITFRGPECKNVIVENNDISNYYDRGIWIYNGGSSPVFRYNRISHIRKGGDHGGSGINVDGYGVRVTKGEVYGNTITDIDMYAITFENGYYASIYNNRTDNGGGVMIWQYPTSGDGSSYAGTGNIDIHHNVFHNGNVGVVLYNAANVKLANNDFVKDNASSTNEGALLVTGSSSYASNISFMNNIVAGKWPHAIKLPDTKNIWSEFDYNNIVPVGTEIVNRGGSATSLSQLQSMGYMTHGITSDPTFVNSISDWHLKQGSPAINTGVNQNYTIDFDGNAIDSYPDMGAFEYAGITPVPSIPVYTGSIIRDATPSVIEMTYNMNLAGVMPATSAFTVTVNSIARTVNSLTITGSNVMLTLSSAVKNGEAVTIAYLKPAANPLQNADGAQAASFTAQAVTNNVSAIVQTPVYVSSVINPGTPSLIVMNYNMALSGMAPSASAFIVKVNSSAVSLSAIALSGSKVMITLANAVKYNDTVTITYTKPSMNPLQSASGGQAASIGPQVVNNKTEVPAPAGTVPEYSGSAISNEKPAEIIISFNTQLATIAPSISAFNVKINSSERKIIGVIVSGSKVILTLENRAYFGDTIRLSYTIPSLNPLQAPDGTKAENITERTVINNIAKLSGGNITVTPNPARTYIEIVVREAVNRPETVKISGLNGDVLSETKIDPRSEKTRINLSLRPGFYVVSVDSLTETLYTRKIIVLRAN
ncbi:MAG TPA: SwmB domain-containing protein [Bacteroidales bacterium]|nr:SwmB domain-containing protein [Bacteroidales bacterium]